MKNKMKISDNSLSKQRLIDASQSNNQTLFNKYNSSLKGLANDEIIKNNLEKYGKNKLAKKNKNVVLKRIIDGFFNPFNIILIILSLVTMVTDVIIPLKKSEGADPSTMVIILAMVLISGILHIVEDTRSNSSAEKLVKMVQTTTRVERNGIYYEIPLEEVAVGDIVILAAGDIIPADVKIISTKDLFVSQSSLTGESNSIEKISQLKNNDKDSNITDYSNLAFMGSNVISGSAKAIVIVTGNDTYLGQVAQKVNAKASVSDFEKGIKSISWLLIKIMLIVVPLVFLIIGLKKMNDGQNWINALLFAISVAVGLTPEMLPMIVTSTLAKGAMSMSKKQTIVKSLNSIQNFGAMDIFCTDKTGTLTLDEVVLEKHLDISGQENSRVLRYGFLNSYYQTGLKNLLDISILNKTEELSDIDESLRSLEIIYDKIDEIPFDFVRKRMSVVVKNQQNNKIQVITKGAVEEILSICTKVEYNNEIRDLDQNMIKMVLHQVDNLNDEGMRVLGVARKNNPSKVGEFSIQDENEMTLIGYLAFLDPPKESTASAIKNLHDNGVDVKILTGDNARVTRAICQKVNIPSEKIMLGKDMLALSDEELSKVVRDYNIFAKLSPDQKARIITLLRKQGHVVGYMGDGINDAPAMKVADVSISVDTAVDIAKESANIILLEKNLNVLATGIIEGRKTYANLNKYIKMTISSNFGNIISILIASIILPFTPMLAVQILFLNLIYDLSCGAIPWDKVDQEFLRNPHKWKTKSILKFMLFFGPVSSIVDVLAYIILRYLFIPQLHAHLDVNSEEFAMLFRTGWFIISMWTQSLVIHFIRTKKIPFVQSKPSMLLLLLTFLGSILVTITPYIPGLNAALKIKALHPYFYIMLFCSITLYISLVLVVKKLYIKKYKELL